MSATARDPRHLLGLASDADLAEVERQYWELQSFLDLRQVPRSLRPWAIRQRALLDGAFAALAGDLDGLAEEPPEAEAPAADEESAESEDDEPEPDPNLPDGPPPREPPVQSTDGRPRPAQRLRSISRRARGARAFSRSSPRIKAGRVTPGCLLGRSPLADRAPVRRRPAPDPLSEPGLASRSRFCLRTEYPGRALR